MPIEVTARHMDGAQAAKGYAEDQAAKLMADFPRVEHVHIILDHEKHRCKAEVVIQGRNHIRVEASETSEDMVNSIDVAIERASRQLRKRREKVQDHRVKPGTVPAVPPEA